MELKIKIGSYLYNTIEYLIFDNNICVILFCKSSLKYLEYSTYEFIT
jgi:hypothetical protein